MADVIQNITKGTPDNETSWVRMPTQVSNIGSPWGLVSDRFDKTAEFAETAFGYTTTYVAEIGELLKELDAHVAPSIEVDMPDYAALGLSIRPKMSDLDLGVTKWPVNSATKPSLVNLPTIPDIDIPVFDISPPNFTDIAAPEIGTVAEPARPVLNTSIDMPAEPEINLPELPRLAEIFIPPPPILELPPFEATFVEELLPTPANFDWKASPYNSDIWGVLLPKTIEGIVNGGTGLPAEVEQMIWNRGKERLRAASQKAKIETETYFAGRGFILPPGAMASRLAELAYETLHAENDLSEKIAIEQAELAQKNTQFMMEFGRQAEIILREFHNAQEARTLDAAKTVLGSSIDVLNAYIAKQNAGLEVYKASAVVYSERIKGALAQAEIYKSTMEGVKVSSEVQKNQVDIYTAQVGFVEAMSKVYVARLEGTKLKQQLESLKIDIYKVDTEVYTAKLGAEKIKADIYSATTEAERTKAMTYGERVKAYVATLEAAKVELETRVAVLDAVAKRNDSSLKQYETELKAFSTETDAVAKQIDGTVSAYSAEVTAYNSETQAQSSYYSLKVKEIDAAIQEAQFNLQKAVAEVEAATKGYIAIKELELKGSEGIMQVSSQLAASALSAVHASANYGFSGSQGLSHSFSYGASITETHSIPHDPED